MAKDIHAQSVPLPKFPMSAFDMGYSLKSIAQIGQMRPHYVEECIPGDIAHIRTDVFCRLDPLTFPIMHKIKVRQNFFFVPSRLILGDENNEEFFSCKDMSAKLPRYEIQSGNYMQYFGKNSLFDCMECQPMVAGRSCIIRNPLPFAMFQKIWLDWYADEILNQTDVTRLEESLETLKDTGLDNVIDPNTISDIMRVRNVAYSKDRFTSAQPDAQRVGEVYLMNPLNVVQTATGLPPANSLPLQVAGLGQSAVPPGSVYVTGSSSPFPVRATLTIDELWDEMAVQRLLNSYNEFGNERYIEILAGQYGVISADARLQRSHWLGGNEMVVNISEVLQTSETTETSPQGNQSGRGIVSGRGRDIAFKVPEHGFIIGVLSFVPENGYASGSPRWLYKQSPLDFALPRLNNLGEQAVYNGELFSDHRVDADTSDLGEFGYQPQYDEYRSHPSRSTGDFRDSQFMAWHLDRKFVGVPPLNGNFIQVDPADTSRIFNDTSEQYYHIKTHCYHKAMYVRPISKHPIPGKL